MKTFNKRGVDEMNKKEWKARYSASRALCVAAARMNKCGNGYSNALAYEAAFKASKDLCVDYSILNRWSHTIYPISENKWAVRHNHRGY